MITPGQLNRRAQLYEQLGSMLAAGVPLIKALEISGKNASLRNSRPTIQALASHLREGFTFADSLIKVQGWLPEFDVAILSVGEQSGKLDASFKLLGRHYASRAQIISQTISRSAYTVVVLHVFLLLFPLGTFIGLVTGFVNNQPALIAGFFIQKIIIFGTGYGIMLFFIFAGSGKRGEPWRALVESIFLKIPLLQTAVKYLALARLAMALGALTNAGVNVIKSWDLAAAACGSPRLKRKIEEWLPQLETGLTPAEMVNQISYFPEMFANLYHTGEISGQIDDTLTRLHRYYEDEGFRLLQWFTRIVCGIVYGTMAVMIGYVVIKFYVGYFNAALNAV